MDVATVACPACGRKDHDLCGTDFWQVQRSEWLGRRVPQTQSSKDPSAGETVDHEVCATSSTASSQRSLPPPLSEQERLNVRSVLVAVETPYPRLKKPIPLQQAVECAQTAWKEAAEQDATPLAKFAEAAKALPQEFLEKTANLGNSIRQWSNGLFGLNLIPRPQKASPTSVSRHTVGALEPWDTGLLTSIRNRGGVCTPRNGETSNCTPRISETPNSATLASTPGTKSSTNDAIDASGRVSSAAF